MKRLAIIVSLILSLFGIASAQNIIGSGIFGDQKAAVVSTYQGPGDVFSGALAWYSCSRAYSQAYATGGGNLCQFTRGSDSLTCIVKAKTNGFADLTTTYCNSNTQNIVDFCTSTSCTATTVYDQSGNARDMTGATAAVPTINFSSSPTGTLPVMTCSGARNAHSASQTVSQPITLSGVVIATGTAANGGAIGGSSSATPAIRQGSSNTLLGIYGGTTLITATTTFNAWHAVQGFANGASSAIDIDGTETTGSAGTAGYSTPFNICAAAVEWSGRVAEAGFWGSSTLTDRTALNTNQHGTNGYNF